ncbi:MAG: hypothetical protein ACTSW5_04120 [Promethearchaeota archaeon]
MSTIINISFSDFALKFNFQIVPVCSDSGRDRIRCSRIGLKNRRRDGSEISSSAGRNHRIERNLISKTEADF